MISNFIENPTSFKTQRYCLLYMGLSSPVSRLKNSASHRDFCVLWGGFLCRLSCIYNSVSLPWFPLPEGRLDVLLKNMKIKGNVP